MVESSIYRQGKKVASRARRTPRPSNAVIGGTDSRRSVDSQDSCDQPGGEVLSRPEPVRHWGGSAHDACELSSIVAIIERSVRVGDGIDALLGLAKRLEMSGENQLAPYVKAWIVECYLLLGLAKPAREWARRLRDSFDRCFNVGTSTGFKLQLARLAWLMGDFRATRRIAQFVIGMPHPNADRKTKDLARALFGLADLHEFRLSAAIYQAERITISVESSEFDEGQALGLRLKGEIAIWSAVRSWIHSSRYRPSNVRDTVERIHQEGVEAFTTLAALALGRLTRFQRFAVAGLAALKLTRVDAQRELVHLEAYHDWTGKTGLAGDRYWAAMLLGIVNLIHERLTAARSWFESIMDVAPLGVGDDMHLMNRYLLSIACQGTQDENAALKQIHEYVEYAGAPLRAFVHGPRMPATVRKGAVTKAELDQILVSKIVDYVRANIDFPLQVSAMARLVGVSRRTVENAFQRVVRESPKSAVDAIRIEAAFVEMNQHRRNGLNLKLIACQFGFASYGTFVRAYRRRYGCSPREAILGTNQSYIAAKDSE